MILIQRVCTPVLLLFAGVLHASVPLTEQVRSELEDVLYPFTSVVPGYQRPAVSAPRIAVAEFRVSSDELLSWSQAISEILRYRIQYVPDVRLYMPAPYNTYLDAQANAVTGRALLTGYSAFQNLNKALGIDLVLTGSVAFNGNEFALTAELVDAVNEGRTLQREWHFPPEDLPAVLISISEWVYHSLGVELTPKQLAYIQDKKSLDRQAIDDFVLHYSELQVLKGPLKRDKVNQLQRQYPNFILLAMYALQNRVYANNLDEAYKNLELYESLRSVHRGNAGIELESYRMMEIGVLPKHEVAARINGLKNLVKENPQDPTIMINFADALVKNGSTLEGIATMLEAVERWPNYYRAWWSLGWALNQHAWQLRGNSMWRDVPERAKEKFKILSHLSDLAIDEALALNPRNADLWELKISTLGSIDGFSQELMEVFDRAVQIAPKEKGIYDNALNFAAQKWGGTSEARVHIIELASKNNPEAAWPGVMRHQNISDFNSSNERHDVNEGGQYLKEHFDVAEVKRYLKELIDNPNTWKMATVFIGIVLWLFFARARRSAENGIKRDQQ